MEDGPEPEPEEEEEGEKAYVQVQDPVEDPDLAYQALYEKLNTKIRIVSEILESNQDKFPADVDAIFTLGALFVGMARDYGFGEDEILTMVSGFYAHTARIPKSET